MKFAIASTTWILLVLLLSFIVLAFILGGIDGAAAATFSKEQSCHAGYQSKSRVGKVFKIPLSMGFVTACWLFEPTEDK